MKLLSSHSPLRKVIRMLLCRPLIFDANYDPFRGTIISVRIINGTIKHGDIMRFMANGKEYKVDEVGLFKLNREPQKQLSAGQVGYILAGIKTVEDTRPGDTITLRDRPAAAASRLQGSPTGGVFFNLPDKHR